MEKEEILQAIQSYIEIKSGGFYDWDYPKHKIELDKPFRNYNLGEIFVVQMLQYIEEKFKVNLGDKPVKDFRTPKDILDAIQSSPT